MSEFCRRFDKNFGSQRQKKIDGEILTERFGTNLSGTRPWRDGFVGPNSGVFHWSGLPEDLWFEVIPTLARDCVLGIGPSLSIINNQSCGGLLMAADIDAEVCELWKPGQCLNLALTMLEAYCEACPALQRGPRRPLFVYSEPARIKTKRIVCCSECKYAMIEYRLDKDDPEKEVVWCGHCEKECDPIVRSSYKIGCHLNGVQHRTKDGKTFDASRSGAVLSTEHHLLVRSRAISLWSKYSSEGPSLRFKTGLPDTQAVVRVLVDGDRPGSLSICEGEATIVLEKVVADDEEECIVEGQGRHSVSIVARERAKVGTRFCLEMERAAHAMLCTLPRDVPSFPGADAANTIIDAAIYGARGSWNGCLRPPYVNKVNQNCICSNEELGITECFRCGGSVSRGQPSCRIASGDRKYIPKARLFSDGTWEPIAEHPDRFDVVVKEAGEGYHAGQVLSAPLMNFQVPSSAVFPQKVSIRIEEVDARGGVTKVSIATEKEHLEYMHDTVHRSRTPLGTLRIDGGCRMEIWDDRLRKMTETLRETCNYLPSKTELTPIDEQKYLHMTEHAFDSQELEEFKDKCDASFGLPLDDSGGKKAAKKKWQKKKDGTFPTVLHPAPVKINKQTIQVKNSKDKRVKALKGLLMKHWGTKNGGIYDETTKFSITVSTKEPEWSKMSAKGTRKSGYATYQLKIMDDARCINAMYCSKHPSMLRRPRMNEDPNKKYCSCPSTTYGRHRGHKTPVFMKVDVDTFRDIPVPKVTLACWSSKMGYKGMICNHCQEYERLKKAGERPRPKFSTGIHPWYEIDEDTVRILYPEIVEAFSKRFSTKKKVAPERKRRKVVHKSNVRSSRKAFMRHLQKTK